jgi:hypothetical protein
MIRKTLVFAIFLFSVHVVFGQYVFMKNYTGIDLGAGYRTIGIEAPGATLNIERGLVQIKKKGAIAAGIRANIIFPADRDIEPSVTLRGTYHVGLFRTKIVDLYTGIGVAFDLEEGHHFHPDTFAGARFKFDKHSKFGVFTEIAYYGTNFNAGISMILN